jgi:hypothetical protein
MSVDRILCLANSYKHDHRCVAGIDLATKRWVRLVGRKIAGCLTVEQTRYQDGTEAALLDVIEAEIGESCGSNSHPEDVFTAEGRWRRVCRFDEPRDRLFLENFVSMRPVLFADYGDRIHVDKFADVRASHSLELVQPDDLWWWIREKNGKRRNRALFRLNYGSRPRYDLAVTDPQWLNLLNFLPAGIYPHSFFFKEKPIVTFLTVSLSEPFENFHYKLVAGVVNLPA